MIRQGSRFGVRLKATAPSIHMIRVDVDSEFAPIIGTEKQSEELVRYLMPDFEENPIKDLGVRYFRPLAVFHRPRRHLGQDLHDAGQRTVQVAGNIGPNHQRGIWWIDRDHSLKFVHNQSVFH